MEVGATGLPGKTPPRGMQGVEAKSAKPAVKPGPVGFQQDPPFNPAVDNKAPSPWKISWSSWKISSSPTSLPSVRSFSAHASANRLLSSRGSPPEAGAHARCEWPWKVVRRHPRHQQRFWHACACSLGALRLLSWCSSLAWCSSPRRGSACGKVVSESGGRRTSRRTRWASLTKATAYRVVGKAIGWRC